MSRKILPRSTLNVHGTVKTHTIRQILRTGAVQQRVHRLTRQLHRIKTGGVLIQLFGIAAAIVILGPALATSTNHDPTAAIGFLITVELLRSAHLRGVQPVGATPSIRFVLLDLPAAGGSTFARRAIVVAGISSLRTGRNRTQRSHDHRNGSYRGAPRSGHRTRRCSRTRRNSIAGRQGPRTPPTHQRKKIHCLSSETSTGSGRVSHAQLSCASALCAPLRKPFNPS